MTNQPQRGRCSVCRREFQINKLGVLRHHLAPRPKGSFYATPLCPGAYRRPLNPKES